MMNVKQVLCIAVVVSGLVLLIKLTTTVNTDKKKITKNEFVGLSVDPDNIIVSLTGVMKKLLSKNVSIESSGNQDDIIVPLTEVMKKPFTLQQDDPKLIKVIREKYLHSPSNMNYNLKQPNNDDPSMGQSREIRNILGDEVADGFFVECGALDGETRSNTLVFEKRFGWKGVLIEGDPKNFNNVQQKRRKAYTVPACLSTLSYPNMVMFKLGGHVGKISQLSVNNPAKGHAEVQCLPLYSILLALNRTTVDYFSLDVEGVELQVLKTIPWDKVDIKTLSVEYIHDAEGKEAIRNFMEEKGYKIYTEVTNPRGLANDFIFYKNGITPKISNSK